MARKGFGIKEILLVEEPNNFPKFGFQVGVIYLKKEHKGGIVITNLNSS